MEKRSHRILAIAPVLLTMICALMLLAPRPALAGESYSTNIHVPITISYSVVTGFGSVQEPVFTSSNEAVAKVTSGGSSVVAIGSSYYIAASCNVIPMGPGATTINYYLGSSLKASNTVTVTGSHTVAHSDAVMATCEQPAMTEGAYCSVCGLTLSGRVETSPALGHSWGDWVTVLEPTATAPGSEERACSACGKVEAREIPNGPYILESAQDMAAVNYVNHTKSKTVIIAKGAKKTTKAATITWKSKISASGNVVNYAWESGSTKITVDRSGTAKLMKGVKRGTYTAKVTVTCGSAERTVNVKFVVK